MSTHASGLGDPRSELGAGGPADDQLVQITTGRVTHDQIQTLVVTAVGEIDRYTVARLHVAVTAGLDQLRNGEILVVDLTKVTFLSSSGLRALIDITEAARQRDAPLRLVVGHTRAVIRPIQTTGLDGVLVLFDTIEQALQTTS